MGILSGCAGDRQDSHETGQPAPYETARFIYPSDDRRSWTDLCEVRYYVNGDTLFTSEKYYFVTLSYQDDDDGERQYSQIVYFDKTQDPDSNGWYHLVFDRNDIIREPHSHLTSLVLRSYLGPKYDSSNPERVHANAYLFNQTDYIFAGRDRNRMTPELKKLKVIQ